MTMKRMVAAAATLAMATSMIAGANRDAGRGNVGPAVVRLVESPGIFEPGELDLPAGSYIFMVTNQGVDHPVDFVLKATRSNDTTRDPSDRAVRNSRLSHRIGRGETASTGVIDLKPGAYTYGSALNPTPGFSLRVR